MLKRLQKNLALILDDILVELGKRKVVGGQEDMIIDVAAELAETKSIG